MQELEKILEEIESKEFTNMTIRHSMVVKMKDDMNDGWIPVEDRLPNEEEFKKAYIRCRYAAEFVVMIRGANRSTTLYFKNGRWFDTENRYYDVIAWCPLPEPYRPERRIQNNDVLR